MRVFNHPILGELPSSSKVRIIVDGKPYEAYENEMIAAALTANGIKTFRFTKKRKEPRGLFCGIGKCTDCIMMVDGIPNVRTCITPVKEGMCIETQHGYGDWKEGENVE